MKEQEYIDLQVLEGLRNAGEIIRNIIYADSRTRPIYDSISSLRLIYEKRIVIDDEPEIKKETLLKALNQIGKTK